MSICIVTPRLPPSMDGLGDYCYQMWHHWPNSDKPQNFLVLDSADESRKFWQQVNITEFKPVESDFIEKLESTQSNTVFLQYVGYGFDKYGCPTWLPLALKRWLAGAGDRRLVIMFHETWSSSVPWQRTFWYRSKQKRCVSDLMSLATNIVTSCEVNRRSMEVLGVNKPIQIIPIGSSFSVSPVEEKNWRQLLIFGKESTRLRAIRTHKKLLAQLIQNNIIERIVLAGQSCVDSDAGLQLRTEHRNIEIVTDYDFSGAAVPDAVTKSGLSLMHTQSSHLLKSTSFQLAAKLQQVAIAVNEGEADRPFQAGKHYLSYLPGEEAGLIEILTHTDRLKSISLEISDAATNYLSWGQIAQTWRELLCRSNP